MYPFFVYLLSSSMIILKFIHTIICINSPLLFHCSAVFHCKLILVFPFTYGWILVGCLQSLAMTEFWWRFMDRSFMDICFLSSWLNLEVQREDDMVDTLLLRNCSLFLKWAHPFTFLWAMYESSSSTSLPMPGMVYLLFVCL